MADKSGYTPGDLARIQTDPTKPAGQRAVSMQEAVDAVAPVWFTGWASDFEKKQESRYDSLEKRLDQYGRELDFTNKQIRTNSVVPAAFVAAAPLSIPLPPRKPLDTLTDIETGKIDPEGDDTDAEQTGRLDAHSVRYATIEQLLPELLNGQRELMAEIRKGRRATAGNTLALSSQTKKLIASTFLAAVGIVAGAYGTTRQGAKDGATEAVKDAPAKIIPVPVPTTIPSGAY